MLVLILDGVVSNVVRVGSSMDFQVEASAFRAQNLLYLKQDRPSILRGT